MITHVVVQRRQRFLRDGLGLVLDSHDDIDVIGSVAATLDLVDLCDERQPDVVVLEMMADEGDAGRIANRLRRRLPRLKVIGLGEPDAELDPAVARGAMHAVISHGGGSSLIVDAIRSAAVTGSANRLRSISRGAANGAETRRLTPREMTVLAMIAGGWTSREISSQLRISVKTVENHKQKIFGKLGVQNQAHAVSLAMRQGLLAPERVVEVSAG